VRFPRKILLAEDNVVNQKVATRMLNKFGCEVDIAVDGAEAVEKWSEGCYNAIFMDCQMPELDGYAATALIRSREIGGDSRTPIIAMTANAMAGDREKCIAAGMDDYLTKPVTTAKLAEALEKWVKGYVAVG